MPFLPVKIRGDANTQVRGIAALLQNMPNRVQPMVMPLICAQINSTRGFEQFIHVSAVPKARKWDKQERAGGVVGTLSQVITNDTYEVSLAIDGDDWKDDQIGAYQSLAAQVAKSLILCPDELVTTNLIANGASIVAYDGQNFYSTGHKWPNGEYTTSQSNLQTQSGTTGDKIENDFYMAKAAMATWRDDRGRLRIAPQEIEGENCLVVHYPAGDKNISQNMNRVFGISKNGDPYDVTVLDNTATQSYATNRKSALAGKAILIPDGYLTGDDWYLHCIGGESPERPFVFLDREPPFVVIYGPGSEHYDKYNEVLILGKRRFGLGVLRPERSQAIR